MENNTMNQVQPKTRNNWKVATIILAIVTLLLAGTTTWFAIRNSKKDTDTVQEDNDNDESSDNNTGQTGEDDDEGNDARYLTITEWGIRLRVPDAFSELEYSITDNRLDFSGILLTAYGVESENSNFSFDSTNTDQVDHFIRHPKNNDPIATECMASCPILLTTNDNYNIYVVSAQYGGEHSSTELFYFGISDYLIRLMIINAGTI